MNTTTYERAKAYECVSRKVKDFFEGKQKMYGDVKQTLEYLFPELVESGDERIREEIISIVKSYRENCITEGNHRFDDCLAWLEKQGEQKPVWSKEDITNYSKVLFCLQTLTFPTDVERKELITWLKKQGERNSADSYCQDNCKGFQETGKCYADGECKAKREAEQNIEEEFDDFFNLESVIDIVEMYGKGEVDLYGSNVTSELKWLKSLRDRLQPQQKQEWSDEDEKYINDILAILGGGRGYRSNRQIEEWLKSLKPQPHWKPTDEQLMALRDAIDNNEMESLYNDLKKL